LGSPYFCPEFTLAVAEVCKDVRIAVLEDARSIVGFFPFQSRWTIGAPVGRLLSDHHGVICAPDTRWDWAQLLRAARLSCWRFDHLCESQAPRTAVHRAASPGLDLSAGFAAYKAGRLALHGNNMRSFDRKARKLEREVGPVRYVDQVNDASVFDALLRLKSAQQRRTGAAEIFHLPWTQPLLDRIRHIDLPHFAGRLSALYAGETLVGAHLGMRSERVWHWWIPVYEPSLARHSPGVQLLLLTAAAAAAQGHQLLDLGKGDEGYKAFFADHATPLVEGAFTPLAAASSVVTGPYRAAKWLLSTPVGQRLRPLLRRVRGL
jgi:CelD/BcsL family acetyltransferase involved in cellulose biosynthesis